MTFPIFQGDTSVAGVEPTRINTPNPRNDWAVNARALLGRKVFLPMGESQLSPGFIGVQVRDYGPH
jgi:hypothetical protein